MRSRRRRGSYILTPTSTYRRKLRSGLTSSAAHSLVDDFDALGVSHLYLSPILRTGSGASDGPAAEHVIAFARERSGPRVVCAAGRFFTRLPSPPAGDAAWRDTVLGSNQEAGRVHRELLSGRMPRGGERGLSAAAVFRCAPLGVLVSARQSSTEEER